MSFLAPLFLLLGAAAAVPLLLHLMRRNIATQVEFPAARYLQRAEQEHSRSMRLRNLLLMLLRVLLVACLALAAARPFIAGLGIGHGPTAVAVVLDNSLSTTAVADGAPVFSRLRDAAAALVQATTPADRVWLVTSDGRVRGGSREAIGAELARLGPSEDAGDLALALRRAEAAVQGSSLPARSIAVATDGQASAWADARRVGVPLSLFVPGGTPPRNRGVLALTAEPALWTPRGEVTARIDAADSVGYRLLIGARTLARGAVTHGEPVQLRVAPPERGWQALRIELEPDDYAADDARNAAVWLGPPAGVSVDASAGPFIATGVATLVGDGRAAKGSDVHIASADAVSSLPALLTPPADPVRLGAANRGLARLGIPWRFAAVVNAPAIAHGGRLDDVAVAARYRLTLEGAGATDTIATAGGEPWIVAGPRYVLAGSRIDPAATSLPVRAVFVPWLADVIGLRLGAEGGEVTAPVLATPGAAIQVPAGVDALESTTGSRQAISAEHATAPAERGVYFLLHGAHRVGALVVNAPASGCRRRGCHAATAPARTRRAPVRRRDAARAPRP